MNRVLVVTSYSAAVEPRAVRNAVAARLAFPDAEITFLERLPSDVEPVPMPAFDAHRIARRTLRLATRRTTPLRRTANFLATRVAERLFRVTGRVGEALFGPQAIGLAQEISRQAPDLIIAHTMQALPGAYRYARTRRVPLIFDVFEYYSEMGDAQTSLETAATKVLERTAYKDTALVLATSEELANVLVEEFTPRRTLVSYNVPPLCNLPARAQRRGLALYWRNSTVALSQRGLGDIIEALPDTPDDVELYVQGRLSKDVAAIRALAADRGVSDRVHILPPFAVGSAVKAAAAYDVGLCLERRGPRNHELTISNKFFDYHMAGLALICSDMPSLKAALTASGGGLTFEAGSPGSLARAINTFHRDRNLLERSRQSARQFAEKRGNLEYELRQLSDNFRMWGAQ